MTVSTFIQPDRTTQSGSAYPANIDAAIAVLAEIAAAFAPHAQGTPNMTVRVDAGKLHYATGVLAIAAQSTGTITAPVTNPRIDRVVIDATTGAVSVITGAESGSPVAPALTENKLPICKVALATSTTVIANSLITDERVSVAALTTLSLANTWAQPQVFSGLITANGGQIKFPATQNPSADANTFDDYEEGTFTPTLLFGGASVGIAYSVQEGFYTKIGNMVFINGRVATTTKSSSTGNASIGGLPIAIGSHIVSWCLRVGSTVSYTGMLQAYSDASSQTINIQQVIEAGTSSTLTDANFSNVVSVTFSGHYRV
jgi:hypothetical protein